jgi:CDP-diacylglycerol--glycerol-3-phosphate 3-phosphatidyltransferase
MNLANKLTLSRIFMVPFLVLCLMPQKITSNGVVVMVARYLAVAIFVASMVTDYFDGLIARRRNMITNFGRLMDPLADKLIVTSALVALVDLNIFPAWFVIVILFREFIVTGLRMLGTQQGRVIQADRWGKHKTLWQMVTIVLALVFLALRDTLKWADLWYRSVPVGHDHAVPVQWWFENVLIMPLIVVCLVLTVVSGTLYVVRNWDLVREDAETP